MQVGKTGRGVDMASAHQPASRVPPGFRFHPTDEELVSYYLRKKVNFEKFDLDVIRDVDLNKLEPWDLHERCRIDTAQQTEWYFFSHKDKKYPTGTRTNRATAAGFWKATGRDKAVHTVTATPGGGHVSKRIGMRKTLVFYRGRAPHGQKTDWIMHEYRLEDGPLPNSSSSHDHLSNINEDGWVVCRVFKKRIHHQKPSTTQPASHQSTANTSEEEQSSLVDNSNYYHEHYKTFQVKNTPFTASSCLNISCKQEEDYDDILPVQAPFLHMPPLESPKHTGLHDSILFPDLVDYHGKRSLLSEEASCFKREAHSSPFALVEMPSLDTTHYTKSLIFGGDQDNLVDSYGEENDEWGVLESLPKDLRYHHLSSNNLCNTILSANCDMEIWKPLL